MNQRYRDHHHQMTRNSHWLHQQPEFSFPFSLTCASCAVPNGLEEDGARSCRRSTCSIRNTAELHLPRALGSDNTSPTPLPPSLPLKGPKAALKCRGGIRPMQNAAFMFKWRGREKERERCDIKKPLEHNFGLTAPSFRKRQREMDSGR